jgi:hypothetical protein
MEEKGMRMDLFCTRTVRVAPAGISCSMRPHSFRKFRSAAVRIHTMKCWSACTARTTAYAGLCLHVQQAAS